MWSDVIFIESLSHLPLNYSPFNTCDTLCENGLVFKISRDRALNKASMKHAFAKEDIPVLM
jgi:hypothetical protein